MDNTCLYPQTELFSSEETGGISLEEVFEAYFACRRHKRDTYNALAFEADYERGTLTCGVKSTAAHIILSALSPSLYSSRCSVKCSPPTSATGWYTT